MPDILKQLEQNLSNWNPQLQPAQGAGSIPHVFITVAGLTGAIAQISSAQKVAGAEPPRDGVDILQIFIKLPFEMDPQRFDETAMLISIINAKLPTIGFFADPSDRKVAFRYMHLINPNDPNMLLIDEALSNIDVVLDLYRDVIQSVATGKQSYELALQSLP